jgi:hypothetical protein
VSPKLAGARGPIRWVAPALVLAAVSAGHAQTKVLPYETQRTLRELGKRSFELDPDPEGKRIAFVELASEDVFVDDEVWPVWPNHFHWLTDPSVIRRELLVREGDAFDTGRVEESTRNLRSLGIFALVRIVAVRTPDPAQVGLLVYTRDLWSLRLETPFSGTGDALYLTVQLTELNLFGRGKILRIRSSFDPKTFSIGQTYSDPRVLGGELMLRETFDVIFNKADGKSEGSAGSLTFGHPYYDWQQLWSWTLKGSYSVFVSRSLRGGDVVSFRPDPEQDGQLMVCEVPAPDCLRAVWDDRSAATSLSGSYQRGERVKQTFTLGVGFSVRDARANSETDLEPGQESAFEDQLLPRSRRQVYPSFRYDLALPLYATYVDLVSFGQSENVQLGPALRWSVTLPLRAFGSSSDAVTFSSAIGYVWGDGHTLLEANVAVSARLEDGKVVDQSASGYVRGATPTWVLGRLVFYGGLEANRRDTDQTQLTLGGDNGLRGYPSGEFRAIGGSRMHWNLEYRTLPLVIQSVHVGAVAFYDAGSVYTSLAHAELHQAVGLGLRILLPQVNRTPFRIDFGVPLSGGFSVVIGYGSDQAIPLTASEDALAAAARARTH